MSDYGIRVEAERIVIRNRSLAGAHIFGGVLQLGVVIGLLNIRFDAPVLIPVAVLVGAAKLVSWVRKWRRRLEFDLSGITIVNFWKRYEFAWTQIAKISIRAVDAQLSNSRMLRPELVVHVVDVPVGTPARASLSVRTGRRDRMAYVLRSNRVLVRRPAEEMAALAAQLVQWNSQNVIASPTDLLSDPPSVADDFLTARARRPTLATVATLLIVSAVIVGSMAYLMYPLIRSGTREAKPAPIDLSRLTQWPGSCGGELVAPSPFSLTTPLETVALRIDGRDTWKVHAKFNSAWNFAQHVSLDALDASIGYIDDMPGALTFPEPGTHDLTLVIGDGNTEVEVSCYDRHGAVTTTSS